MCVVSNVSDYGRSIPSYQWNWGSWEAYQELLRKAAEFDRIAQQPDCEDPEKAKWMKAIDERLRKLEVAPGNGTATLTFSANAVGTAAAVVNF